MNKDKMNEKTGPLCNKCGEKLLTDSTTVGVHQCDCGNIWYDLTPPPKQDEAKGNDEAGG